MAGGNARLDAKLAQRLQPKLQMVANGDTEVNVFRAEQCSAVALSPQRALKAKAQRRGRQTLAVPATGAPALRRKLTEPADAIVSVFVQLDDDRDVRGLDQTPLTAVKGTVGTAELPVRKALELAASDRVAYTELGQPLVVPVPTLSTGATTAPTVAGRRVAGSRRHGYGAGVLIGLIDVGGFDFAHPDFLDRSGETRFVRIWDQGGVGRPSPAKRRTVSVRLRRRDPSRGDERRDRARPKQGLPATELEPQSAMSPDRTGRTSPASRRETAASAGTLGSPPFSSPFRSDEISRRNSFYDSTRLAACGRLPPSGRRRAGAPISINISLGTNGHAHDDSAPINRWIDASLTRPGPLSSASRPETPGRNEPKPTTISAGSWGDSIPPAGSPHASSSPTSHGLWSEIRSPTSRRTSSRSGTGRRISSRSR